MPSKFRTGDNQFGGAEVGSAKGITGANGLDSAVTRLERKIAQGQPRASQNQQVTHLPGGVITREIIRGKNKATASPHPWQGSLSGGTSSMVIGLIFDGPHSLVEIVPTIIDIEMSDGDVMCLELTITDGDVASIQNIVVPSDSYEAFTEAGGLVLTTILPLYKVVDIDDALRIDQMARNNYAVGDICFDGTPIKSLLPL